jgi:hypothetical protein
MPRSVLVASPKASTPSPTYTPLPIPHSAYLTLRSPCRPVAEFRKYRTLQRLKQLQEEAEQEAKSKAAQADDGGSSDEDDDGDKFEVQGAAGDRSADEEEDDELVAAADATAAAEGGAAAGGRDAAAKAAARRELYARARVDDKTLWRFIERVALRRYRGRASVAFDGKTYILEKHEGLDPPPDRIDTVKIAEDKRASDCRALLLDPQLAEKKRREAGAKWDGRTPYGGGGGRLPAAVGGRRFVTRGRT